MILLKNGYSLVSVLAAVAIIAIFSIFSLNIIADIQRNMMRLKNVVMLDIELSHVSAQIHSFVSTPAILRTIELSDPLTEISINTLRSTSTEILLYSISATRVDYSKTMRVLQVSQ